MNREEKGEKRQKKKGMNKKREKRNWIIERGREEIQRLRNKRKEENEKGKK